MIDLVIIGDVNKSSLNRLVKKAEGMIKRKIRVMVLVEDEFESLRERLEADNHLPDVLRAIEEKRPSAKRHAHRDAMVIDQDGRFIGKLTMLDILRAIEPNFRKIRKAQQEQTLTAGFVRTAVQAKTKPRDSQGGNNGAFLYGAGPVCAGLEIRLVYGAGRVTDIPMIGQTAKTKKPVTTISNMLAGIPYRKNSPVVNCLES